MKIGIVGAGAIGSTFAWFLARAGHDVALFDVRADQIAAVSRGGLVAELPDGTAVSARVVAAADPSALEPAAVVLLATKAFATEAAARGAGPLIGAETWVASVQNGLGNDRALARAIGPERVIPGSTTVAAEAPGLGRVRIGESVLAGLSSTVFGPPRGTARVPGPIQELVAALSGAGLPAQVLPDVELVIWRKLVLAGSMGPLSAALGLTVAGTMANPAALGLLRRLVGEIVAVARSSGVALDPDEAWALCESTFGGLGEHRASMAVDLAQGRRTEIDAMCGEVARLGRERDVPTPVNEVVGELVRALEAEASSRSADDPATTLARAGGPGHAQRPAPGPPG